MHEATYDLDELTNYNLHMHTHYSRCGKPEMTVENIIAEAERCGIKEISLNDHLVFPEECKELFAHNEILRKEVEETGTKIKVYIGGEFSLYDVDKYTLKGMDEYKPDYRLYAENHYHIESFTAPEEKTPEAFKNHMIKKLTYIFNEKAADCIAHPIYGKYSAELVEGKFKDCVEAIGEAWSDNELGDIMQLGYESGCAWELNRGAIFLDPKFFRRMFNIGREIGVVFNYGTDAHTLDCVDPKLHLDELKKILL